MRLSTAGILGVCAALTIGCKSSTGFTPVAAGTWTLTITSLQGGTGTTCPATVTATLVVTQQSKHSFNGTYTATPASCTGPAGTVAIVNASGTILNYGTVAKGSITFSLDTQQGPSPGGAFTGSFTGTSGSGTVAFNTATPSNTINGNWTLAKA